MYYPNYLIHYNKNHSSKNGQFVSGDGDGDGIANDHAHRKEAFNGKSRAQYVNEMQGRYRKEGESKLNAKRYANYAANWNKTHTNNYNGSIKRAKEYSNKAEAEKRVGNIKAYNKYTKKMIAAYRDAKINEKMIERAYDLGRSAAKESDLYLLSGMIGMTAYQESHADSTTRIRRQIEYDIDKK